MEHLLELFDILKNNHANLYIQNYELRVTYHLENRFISYWENSSYYNSSEVVDTSDIWRFLNLDFREKDISDTLMQEKWYFLLWEMVSGLPDYIVKFIEEYQDKIIFEQPKIIKRTFWNSFLVYLRLRLPLNKIHTIKKYSKKLNEILKTY